MDQGRLPWLPVSRPWSIAERFRDVALSEALPVADVGRDAPLEQPLLLFVLLLVLGSSA